MLPGAFRCRGGWEEALRLSLLLVGVNVLYTLRAFTEEKLCRKTPRGCVCAVDGQARVVRGISRLCPFMKYEHRLKKWLASGELKILPREHFQK